MKSPQPPPGIPDIERAEFESSYAQHSAKLRGCTEEFLVTLEYIRKAGDKNAEVIWNAAFHINIVAHDLLSLLHFLATADDSWARRTMARFIALLLFEACEDIPQLQGGTFRAACQAIGFFPLHESDLNAAGKYVSGFKARNLQMLKAVRDSIAAHKGPDTFELARLIADMEVGKIFQLGVEFYEILKGYGAVNMKAITAVAKRRAVTLHLP